MEILIALTPAPLPYFCNEIIAHNDNGDIHENSINANQLLYSGDFPIIHSWYLAKDVRLLLLPDLLRELGQLSRLEAPPKIKLTTRAFY